MAALAPFDLEIVMERALGELPRSQWRVIDTRGVEDGPQADYVVVGPPGVFVIGWGRREERERARGKQLLSLVGVAHAMAEVAGVRPDEVHPVLCLSGNDPEDSWSRGVSICGAVNLADTLMFKRERLERSEIEAAADAVRRHVRRASGRHRAPTY